MNFVTGPELSWNFPFRSSSVVHFTQPLGYAKAADGQGLEVERQKGWRIGLKNEASHISYQVPLRVLCEPRYGL